MNEINRSISDGGYILKQSTEEFKKTKFGLCGNVADNGCGAIAAFNMFRANGITLPLTMIIHDLRKRLGFYFFGLLGTDPFALWFYLRRYLKVRFAFCTRSAAERFKNCTSVTIVYFWRRKTKIGAHYICGVRANDGQFEFCNYGRDISRSALPGFVKGMKAKHESPLFIIGAYGPALPEKAEKSKSGKPQDEKADK